MNTTLFIVFLIISFIVVRIGAIAFQLTGLEWSLAKFQALSCFSGTGFTTKEAELVVSNPQRRRIASVLIVFGNAGLVTMIATLANSIRPRTAGTKISLPFLKDFMPASWVPWISVVIIAVFIFAIYKLFTNIRLSDGITKILRRFILKRDIIKPVTFEELLVSTGGYGVSRITLFTDSPVLNKTLNESRLRSHDITVLTITRGHETIPNPSADMSLLLNDELICFGRLENIKTHLCAQSKQE